MSFEQPSLSGFAKMNVTEFQDRIRSHWEPTKPKSFPEEMINVDFKKNPDLELKFLIDSARKDGVGFSDRFTLEGVQDLIENKGIQPEEVGSSKEEVEFLKQLGKIAQAGYELDRVRRTLAEEDMGAPEADRYMEAMKIFDNYPVEAERLLGMTKEQAEKLLHDFQIKEVKSFIVKAQQHFNSGEIKDGASWAAVALIRLRKSNYVQPEELSVSIEDLENWVEGNY